MGPLESPLHLIHSHPTLRDGYMVHVPSANCAICPRHTRPTTTAGGGAFPMPECPTCGIRCGGRGNRPTQRFGRRRTTEMGYRRSSVGFHPLAVGVYITALLAARPNGDYGSPRSQVHRPSATRCQLVTHYTCSAHRDSHHGRRMEMLMRRWPREGARAPFLMPTAPVADMSPQSTLVGNGK